MHLPTVVTAALLFIILLAFPALSFVDLAVNQTGIIFSATSPVEGQNITINATISNLGNDSVQNAVVRFLHNSSIIADKMVNISPFSSLTVSEFTIAEIGTNNITVIADLNNSISEANENNNVASRIFSVQAYHTYYGTVQGSTALGIGFDFLLEIEDKGCNVLVADTDSSVDFTSLQAIGRRKNVGPALNDFIDIDALLGMTDFEDSISAEWTLFGNFPSPLFKLFPKKVETFTIFGTNITNVPVINSTNSTTFRTGILWDSSDDSSGFFGQFDQADKEDLIFVTKVNASQQGNFGSYDYEIKIPALLRDYKPGSSTVDFFIDVDSCP